MTSNKLHLWESALLMAFALWFTAGVWASAGQAALADRVLRLHVVAHSDGEEDQQLKLAVRDAVLVRAAPLLEGISDPASAEAALLPHLDELAEAGRQVLISADCPHPVSVTVEDGWFPTRDYGSFALPAGNYRSLRVVIGEGGGRNWWCVVFPPLCLATVTEEVAATAAAGGLSGEQISLITGRDGSYVLRFKVVEWWQELLRKWRP